MTKFAWIVVVLAITGCSRPAALSSTDDTIFAQFVRENGCATADSTGLDSLIQADNAFGLQVFQSQLSTYESGPNYLLSTLSLTQALQMLLNGTQGVNEALLLSQLGLSGSLDDVNASIRQLLLTVGCRKNYELQVANSFWSSLPAGAAFTQAIQNDFAGQIFSNPSGTLINQWVSDNTDGMITNVVDPNTNIPVFLVNALYFQGTWSQTFQPPQPWPFTLDNGDTVDVPTVWDAQRSMRVITWNGFSVAEITYGAQEAAQQDASMIFLLPPAGVSPEQAFAGITAQTYSTLESALEAEPFVVGEIVFPTFSFSEAFDLLGYLNSAASNMSYLLTTGVFPAINASLQIASASQQTRIDVTASGTTAAAVTTIGLGETAMPVPAVTFVANHPFAFILRDRSGQDLFIGTVHDPRD